MFFQRWMVYFFAIFFWLGEFLYYDDKAGAATGVLFWFYLTAMLFCPLAIVFLISDCWRGREKDGPHHR